MTMEVTEDGDDAAGCDELSAAIRRLDKARDAAAPTRNAPPRPSVGEGVGALPSVLAALEASDSLGGGGDGALSRLRKSGTAPLPRPLERHERAKIERATGFEEVRAKLDRWNAIVARNRAAEHREFPLRDLEERTPQPVDAHVDKYRLKSALESELDALEPEAAGDDSASKTFPLTMAEMIEHRKETARLRAKQSYREAKARRQGKIKSKKFHRIQRKERMRAQLKEFEILQRTDPEEALRKLEQLEKTRAEERVTLRHKSTGHWAKNKLVRAKYDKETRQQLAEQLAISRELTQKIDVEGESESESEQEAPIEDPFNPWMRRANDETALDNLNTGYKKIWENKNATNGDVDSSSDSESEEKNGENVKSDDGEESEMVLPTRSIMQRKIVKPEKMKKVVASTTDWSVEGIDDSKDSSVEKETVDDLFEELMTEKRKNVEKRLKNIVNNNKGATKRIAEKRAKKEKESELSKLSFKNKKAKPTIDEALDEGARNESANSINNLIAAARGGDKIANKPIDKIDPNKFVAPEPRHLLSALPDADVGDDYMDDDEASASAKRLTIAEAFEDDDIVADFDKEKSDAMEKSKPNTADDSFLPGWGSWTGKTITAKSRGQRRRRRIFVGAPKVVPRKDDRRPTLIVDEEANAKIRAHLVAELPFPFTSVSDFEASIRAPLGNTFVPETAHKKLTRPAVTTRTGVIIKPMDETQLLNRGKMKGNKAF